jgi:lysophospholipase L1-like esterase
LRRHFSRSVFVMAVFCAGLTCQAQVPVQAVIVTEAPTLPVQIAPDNSDVRYGGRFDTHDPAGPQCAWPASSVALRFRGTALNASIGDTDADRWQVEVDGTPTVTLQMHSGRHLYSVVSHLPLGIHTVRLVKATEAFVGTAQFLGYQLNQGAKLFAVPARPHRLEVIGDSISCGYGDEAANQAEHFSPQTENAYFAYGAVAARALNASYTCIAWSGKKMWPDDTMPELYDRTLPVDSNSQWNFTRWTPDVIIINLATNDFAGKTVPDETGWTNAYTAFIARLRTQFPQSQIYCATGPMMYGPNLATLQDYLTKMIADIHAAGDTKVHLLEFATQDPKNGFGADWHPNLKTHEIMAAKLISTLQTDLGWSVKPD